MYQSNPLTETVKLAPPNATKAQKKKLAKYVKQHMFIRKATNPKNGNRIVKNLSDTFIKNGYSDSIPINQEELDKAISQLGI